jgi:hypothetical protein
MKEELQRRAAALGKHPSLLVPEALARWLAEAGGYVVVRDAFPAVWFREQCSVLQQ